MIQNISPITNDLNSLHEQYIQGNFMYIVSGAMQQGEGLLNVDIRAFHYVQKAYERIDKKHRKASISNLLSKWRSILNNNYSERMIQKSRDHWYYSQIIYDALYILKKYETNDIPTQKHHTLIEHMKSISGIEEVGISFIHWAAFKFREQIRKFSFTQPNKKLISLYGDFFDEKASIICLMRAAKLGNPDALLYIKNNDIKFGQSFNQLSKEEQDAFIILLQIVKQTNTTDMTARQLAEYLFEAPLSNGKFFNMIIQKKLADILSPILEYAIWLGNINAMISRAINMGTDTELKPLENISKEYYDFASFIIFIKNNKPVNLAYSKQHIDLYHDMAPKMIKYIVHSELIVRIMYTFLYIAEEFHDEKYIGYVEEIVAQLEVSRQYKDEYIKSYIAVLKGRYNEAFDQAITYPLENQQKIMKVLLKQLLEKEQFAFLEQLFEKEHCAKYFHDSLAKIVMNLFSYNAKKNDIAKAQFYLLTVINEYEDKINIEEFCIMLNSLFPTNSDALKNYLDIILPFLEKKEDSTEVLYTIVRLNMALNAKEYIKTHEKTVISLINRLPKVYKLTLLYHLPPQQSKGMLEEILKQIMKEYNVQDFKALTDVLKERSGENDDIETQQYVVGVLTILGLVNKELTLINDAIIYHQAALLLIESGFASYDSLDVIYNNIALCYLDKGVISTYFEYLNKAQENGYILDEEDKKLKKIIPIFDKETPDEELFQIGQYLDKLFSEGVKPSSFIASAYYYKEGRLNKKYELYYNFIIQNHSTSLNPVVYLFGQLLYIDQMLDKVTRKQHLDSIFEKIEEYQKSLSDSDSEIVDKVAKIITLRTVSIKKLCYEIFFGDNMSSYDGVAYTISNLIDSSGLAPNYKDKDLERYTQSLLAQTNSQNKDRAFSWNQKCREIENLITTSGLTNSKFIQQVAKLGFDVTNNGVAYIITDRQSCGGDGVSTSFHFNHGKDDYWDNNKTNSWKKYIGDRRRYREKQRLSDKLCKSIID